AVRPVLPGRLPVPTSRGTARVGRPDADRQRRHTRRATRDHGHRGRVRTVIRRGQPDATRPELSTDRLALRTATAVAVRTATGVDVRTANAVDMVPPRSCRRAHGHA